MAEGAVGGNSKLSQNSKISSGVLSAKPKTKTVQEMDVSKWICAVCTKAFTDPRSRLLECEFCEKHFCIKCLQMSVREYETMKTSTAMWFCGPCKCKVTENIATEKTIQEKCELYLKEFAGRLEVVEQQVQLKCDEERVREIVRNEMDTKPNEQEEGATHTNINHTKSGAEATIKELNDRRDREPNLIVFNAKETKEILKADRLKDDKKLFQEICEQCEANIDVENDVEKIVRLGTKTDETKPRPMLISLKKKEQKKDLFRNLSKLKDSEYSEVRVAHDMTKQEREESKKMYEEAKKMQEQSGGNYRYKVRGPPWARKIVRVKDEGQ